MNQKTTDVQQAIRSFISTPVSTLIPYKRSVLGPSRILLLLLDLTFVQVVKNQFIFVPALESGALGDRKGWGRVLRQDSASTPTRLSWTFNSTASSKMYWIPRWYRFRGKLAKKRRIWKKKFWLPVTALSKLQIIKINYLCITLYEIVIIWINKVSIKNLTV